MSKENLFLLPRRFLKSERVESLLDFLKSDVDGFFDQVDDFYSYISIDKLDEEYIKDVGQFMGMETLKFKYSEENQAKAIKNYYALLKYMGGIKAIKMILMTYSFNVEFKYLWTNDFETYVEHDITDVIYGYQREKYLSSYFLVRFGLSKTFYASFTDSVDELLRSSDLGDNTYYYDSPELRTFEGDVTDSEKGTVYGFRKGYVYNDRIEIWDTGNNLDSNIKALMKLDLKGDQAIKYRVKTVSPDLSSFPHAFWHDYSNEVSNPENLVSSSWTKINGLVASDPSMTILGFSLTQLTCDGTSDPQVYQDVSGLTANQRKVASIILKNGNLTDQDSILYVIANTSSVTVAQVKIEWDTNSVTAVTGELIRGIWLDSDSVMIQVEVVAHATDTDYRFRVDPADTGVSDGDYIYATACLLSDNDQLGWFPYLSSGFTVEHNEVPVELRNKITIDIEFKPEFSYDQDSQHCRIFGWRTSALSDDSNALVLYYHNTSHTFYLFFRNDESSTYPSLGGSSFQFDDGTSYIKLNQWIRVVATLDLSTGSVTTGSQMYTVAQETGDFNRDDSWGATINEMTNDFVNAELGRDPGTSTSNAKFKGYIRKFDLYDGVFTDVCTDEGGLDTVLSGMQKIYSHYNEQVSGWSDDTIAGEWSDESEVTLDLEKVGNARMFGIEFRKSDDTDFTTSDNVYAVSPSLDLQEQATLLEDELYLNLRSDVERLMMVDQIFLFESKLVMDFKSSPVGWENLFGNVWIWKNSQYMRTSYTSDSGLVSDTTGLLSDSEISSVLSEFDQVSFGSEAFPAQYAVQDVLDPFVTLTGTLTIDTDFKIYNLEVYLKGETFEYVNEMVIKDDLGNILFYVVFPNWFKTGDKMVFSITMDYSGG